MFRNAPMASVSINSTTAHSPTTSVLPKPAHKNKTPAFAGPFKYSNVDERILDELTKDELRDFIEKATFLYSGGRIKVRGLSTAKRDTMLDYAKTTVLPEIDRANAKWNRVWGTHAKQQRRNETDKQRQQMRLGANRRQAEATLGATLTEDVARIILNKAYPGEGLTTITDPMTGQRFPEKRAVVIGNQTYDARSLVRWFQSDRHSKWPDGREMNTTDERMDEVIDKAGWFPGAIAVRDTSSWRGFPHPQFYRVIRQTPTGRVTAQLLTTERVGSGRQDDFSWKLGMPGEDSDRSPKPITFTTELAGLWHGQPVKYGYSDDLA